MSGPGPQQLTERALAIAAARAAIREARWPTTGPCTRCQTPCTRYGPDGAPWCPSCTGLAPATDNAREDHQP